MEHEETCRATNQRIEEGVEVPIIDRRSGEGTQCGTCNNFRVDAGRIVCDVNFTSEATGMRFFEPSRYGYIKAVNIVRPECIGEQLGAAAERMEAETKYGRA